MSVHGGNVDEISRIYGIDKSKIIDFSANINPLGLSKRVKDAMINAIDKIERYPDITYYDLKKTIGDYEKISTESILLGNGAAEVIFNIVRALMPKKVLLCAPTFSEYEEAALSVDSKIEYYYLSEKNEFQIQEEILEVIDSSIDLIFICNPNNPTGALTNNKLIEKIVLKSKENNAIVVVDESFLDFIKESDEYSAKELLNIYENIIIVKSLTKFFAMPGIRIGYGICKNEELNRKVQKVTIPWAVNIVAADGILVALKDNDYIRKSKEEVDLNKNWLREELMKIDKIKVYKPSVNFILFRFIGNIDIKEELLKQCILIRSCQNYKGLDNSFYRIAVRTKEENKILIDSLKRILIDNN